MRLAVGFLAFTFAVPALLLSGIPPEKKGLFHKYHQELERFGVYQDRVTTSPRDQDKRTAVLGRFGRGSYYDFLRHRESVTRNGRSESSESSHRTGLSDSVQVAWVKEFGLLQPAIDWAHAMAIDSLGNIYVTGGAQTSTRGWTM